jgi:inner membrane protein involved in colicin E2 resistance
MENTDKPFKYALLACALLELIVLACVMYYQYFRE